MDDGPTPIERRTMFAKAPKNTSANRMSWPLYGHLLRDLLPTGDFIIYFTSKQQTPLPHLSLENSNNIPTEMRPDAGMAGLQIAKHWPALSPTFLTLRKSALD